MNNTKLKNHSQQQGFTLIELLIAVVIIGVLAAIAIPSYSRYVIRAHRSDAKIALAEIANLQEKFYSERGRFAATLGELNYPATVGDHYRLDVVTGTPTRYELQARPVPGSNQEREDTACLDMRINQSGIKTPPDCWGR